MATVKIKGLKRLQKSLKDNATLSDVKTAVKQNGIEMQAKMVRNAVFDRGYSTGATKRSIRGQSINGGFAYKAGPGTHYSPYVEYGTRFMSAQPFVRPAYNDQKVIFERDLKKLVK